mgnify:CR=1 FL=1
MCSMLYELSGIQLCTPGTCACCRAVYKASWRQAPVAVKYIVCRTDDHDSLGRAIREVVLSKKMSHPNVVSTWMALCIASR